VAGQCERSLAVPQTSVRDCSLIALRTVEDPRGSLTFMEGERDVPFAIKRVYHLYSVPPGGARGGHAHRRLDQVLIAVAGAFDVVLDDGAEVRRVRLEDPREGLHIPPGVWREMGGFSEGAACVVLASELYEAADYVRDYAEFLAWRKP
jgi:dTDP-4-dehydrorhamnose 3,5-epimerase-like enzyme